MNARTGLARDAAASMARHLVTITVGLATVPILARTLGAERLGFWNLVGTSAFLLGLADLGLNTATLRASAGKDAAHAKRVARVAAWSTVLFGLPAVALSLLWLWATAAKLPIDQQHDARRAVVIALAAGLGLSASQSSRSYAQGQGRIVALAWARAAGVSIQLVVTVALLAGGFGLTAVAAGFAAGALVEAVFGLRAARDSVTAPGWPRGPERAEMLRSASAALVTNLAVAATVRADVFVLERVTNLATIGAYSVAARVVDQGFTLVKQVSAALVPRLGMRAKERASAIRLGASILGVLAAGPLAALALFGHPILVSWAGPEIDLPILGVALAWLAGAAVLAAIAEIPLSALSLAGDPRTAARHIALGALVNISLSISGAWLLGPAAVAAATLLGNLVVAALAWKTISRVMHWPAAVAARTLLPAALAALCALALAFTLASLSIHPVVNIALASAVAVALGAALTWSAHSRPQEAAL